MSVFFRWLILVGGAYVLQSSILPLLSWHGICADLMLLVTVSFAFLRGKHLGTLMGFLTGLLQDLASGTFFGVNAFSKLLAGYSRNSFFCRSWLLSWQRL